MIPSPKMTPLNTSFCFYLWQNPKTISLSTELPKKTKIGPFTTAEEFWGVYQYLKRPNVLPPNSVISLFKSEVQPVVEDPLNKTGGRFIFTLNKNEKGNKIWEDLLIFLLMSEAKTSPFNGVVAHSLDKCVEVSIWTVEISEAELPLVEETIKEQFDENICIQIDYLKHTRSPKELHSKYKNSEDQIEIDHDDRFRNITQNAKRRSVNENSKFEGFKTALENQKLQEMLNEMDSFD